MKRKQLIAKAERMVRGCENLDHLKMAEKYCNRVAVFLTPENTLTAHMHFCKLINHFEDLLEIRAIILTNGKHAQG